MLSETVTGWRAVASSSRKLPELESWSNVRGPVRPSITLIRPFQVESLIVMSPVPIWGRSLSKSQALSACDTMSTWLKVAPSTKAGVTPWRPDRVMVSPSTVMFRSLPPPAALARVRPSPKVSRVVTSEMVTSDDDRTSMPDWPTRAGW